MLTFPYLLTTQEAIKCAQRGGVGVCCYYRKEGRALGEVTKYLVYNARKRGGDNAQDYFRRTEDIAGVKGESVAVGSVTCFALVLIQFRFSQTCASRHLCRTSCTGSASRGLTI